MGMPPTANRNIAVMAVGVAAVKTRPPMPILKLVARRFCMPIKNAAACAASRAPLASLAPPCPVGSKKSSSASAFTYHFGSSPPRGSHFHDPRTGRTDGSFVLKKAHDSWIWIALCRQTRQVVAYAVGDRSKKTCQRLWEAIPEGYRQGHCFTDFWAAYAAVIPAEQHTAVGKETGDTAHVERWNNTLRQRLARFVRMTLSFSKSVLMHEACLLLFLHRYNRDRAIFLT